MSMPSSSSEINLQNRPKSEPDTSSGTRFVPVRFRTYIVGIFAVICVCILVTFGELVASRGGSVDAILTGATHMPPAAIAMLIVMLIANALMGALISRVNRLLEWLGIKSGLNLKLNSAELAVIYFMLVCAALLSSFGLAAQLLPQLAGANYFASPQDHIWRDKFYPHMASWLVPFDPNGPERQIEIVRFYEGLRVGESIPWGVWIKPIIAWSIFAFLLFFLMACVATLFRRQWVDNEKLTFPLVTLPMEMVNDQTRASFLRNKAMWLGFLIPVVVHGLNGLHRSFPSIPELPISLILNSIWKTKPWNEMVYTYLNLSFSIVGFAYLLPLDVSFSLWFFHLFFRFQDYIRLVSGEKLDVMPVYGGSRYYQGMQSAGAFVAIAIMAFWLARPHFKMVKDRVFGNADKDIDQNEFMSYRTAFLGGIVAFFLILVWLTAAGMNPLIALFMIGVFVFIVMLVLTRCVSEVGLLMLQPVFRPMDIWSVFAPKEMIGANNLTVMSFVNGTFIRDPRNPMPTFMDSMKGADYVHARRRAMMIGAMIAIALGGVFALVFQLWVIYTHGGGLQMNAWFFRAAPTLYLNEANEIVSGRAPYRPDVPIWFGVGTVLHFSFML